MIKTNIGAILTLFSFVSLLTYGAVLINQMVSNNEKTFISAGFGYDLQKEGLISMDKFEGTFYFTIGFKNLKYDFDILDNPYVALQAGKAVTDWVISENKDIVMRKCTDEEGYRADGVWYQAFKQNLICLSNPGDLQIKSNWAEYSFENPYFQVV